MKHRQPILAQIADRLRHWPPAPAVPGAGRREAAVLLALTAPGEPEVVLVKRAEHLNSHRGQVALPGGMWDPGDASLLDTALRESEEEIALPRERVALIARLPRRETRMGVPVTPYLAAISRDIALSPDPRELDAVFRVPLAYLLDSDNVVSDRFEIQGEWQELPCYHYQGYRIWGFTFQVLVHFLNAGLGARLRFAHLGQKLAPEVLAQLATLEEEYPQ